MKLQKALSIAGVSSLLIVAATFVAYPKWRQGKKAQYHAEVSNFIRMRALYQCIVEAAIRDPQLFGSVVGGGLVTDAVSFPEKIRKDFLFNTNQITLLYWDRWERPFNVSVKPIISSHVNSTNYEVLVWSCGPNGLNEDRKGDDILLNDIKVE